MRHLINLFKRTKSKQINIIDEIYFINLNARIQILRYKMDNYKQTNNK